MKSIYEHIENALFEIGDSSAGALPYKLNSNSIKKTDVGIYGVISYSFDVPVKGTEKIVNYQVACMLEGGVLTMAFAADGTSTGIMNTGNIFQVMATITEIIKEIIKKYKWVPVTQISFEPAKKSEEQTVSGSTNTQRYKLYMSYIKKNIPNAEPIIKGNDIYINLK